MLNTTKTALGAILSSDPSITPEQKKAAIQAATESTATEAAPIARIVKRTEASKILGLGLKRIDQLARAGILKRVTIAGCKRSIGFSEASLRAITEGQGAA